MLVFILYVEHSWLSSQLKIPLYHLWSFENYVTQNFWIVTFCNPLKRRYVLIRGLQYVMFKSFALRNFSMSPYYFYHCNYNYKNNCYWFKNSSQLGSLKYLMIATYNFKIFNTFCHVSFITTWKVSWVINGLGGGANRILEQFQTILKCMGCL